jgi:hypothetical protein
VSLVWASFTGSYVRSVRFRDLKLCRQGSDAELGQPRLNVITERLLREPCWQRRWLPGGLGFRITATRSHTTFLCVRGLCEAPTNGRSTPHDPEQSTFECQSIGEAYGSCNLYSI